MAERELKKKPERNTGDVIDTGKVLGETAVDGASTDKVDELKAELDDLLDEIDEVLEINAEEFVKGFIQKGGQ